MKKYGGQTLQADRPGALICAACPGTSAIRSSLDKPGKVP